MKFSKIASGIFAVLGIVMAAFTVFVSLQAMKAEPAMLKKPEAATVCAGKMLDAVCEGKREIVDFFRELSAGKKN